MFLILSIASLFSKGDDRQKPDEKIEEKVEANMVTLLNNLKESDYSYEYKITKNDSSYSYSGTKQDEEVVGFYENNNIIIKYQLIDNIAYKIENDEKIEDATIFSEEDLNYLNIDNIINEIKTFEETNKVLIEDNIYTYNINDTYKIQIIKSSTNITNINIDINNIEYSLEYKNVINK